MLNAILYRKSHLCDLSNSNSNFDEKDGGKKKIIKGENYRIK